MRWWPSAMRRARRRAGRARIRSATSSRSAGSSCSTRPPARAGAAGSRREGKRAERAHPALREKELLELIQQRPLAREDLASRSIERKPFAAVDLGVRAPMQHERVAAQRARVAVAFSRPRVHDLATGLLHGRERHDGGEVEIDEPRLLAELATRRVERI